MRIVFSLLIVFIHSLSAAEEGRQINCRFASLDSSVAVPAMLVASLEGAEVPVSVPTSSISKPVVCFSKDNSLTFLSAADRTPLATTTIPATTKAAILLFVAAPKGGKSLPWRIFVIEDSDKNFPDGGAFVANFHNQEVRFIIGEHKVLLPPGKFNGVARPVQRDDFNMAPVVFQFRQGDAWKDASESMLRFLPGSRYLMFTFIDETSGRPKIVTFQDFKATEPAAAVP